VTLNINDSALLVVMAKNLQKTIEIDTGMDRPYRDMVACPVRTRRCVDCRVQQAFSPSHVTSIVVYSLHLLLL